ncbi:hypothetical protein BD560DRAFT_384028 [Blakeslea trispora]|nr:hypothetical protein BD560DRAFT_384028 [Blakeslea trispora]
MSKSILFRFYKTKRGIAIMSLICLTFVYTMLSFVHAPLPLQASTSSAPHTINRHTYTHSNLTEEERFLAYLPHSGLSNQRIELANALLMSYMLNRTLLVPPAFLGTVFGWSARESIEDQLDWLTTPKDFAKICQTPTPGILSSYVQTAKCSESRRLGVMPWSELHDLDQLMPDIRIRYQHIYTEKQMRDDLHLQGDHDIFRYQDDQLYDWRLFENKTLANELVSNKMNYFDSFGGRRYYKVLLPHHFAQYKHKLLFLGGIFGSTRLNLESHDEMHKKIKRALHYRLDTPLGETVNGIVDYLGGRGSFQSIHFRTGDKPFRKEIHLNLNRFIGKMTTIIQDNRPDATIHENKCLPIVNDATMDWHESTMIPMQLKNDARIYVATDYHQPRRNQSELLPLFRAFPCTTTLDDVPSQLLSPLDDIQDMMEPSKPLKMYLIPLVDAMVAAHGENVLTTPRSTFSQYIQELHIAWS